ncbi:MAG: prolipoprotein diacylglyceryl transferase [Candidatus Hydrogenedens sp.]
MFSYLFIHGYEIELYHVFNFLAVFAVMILGILWNYRRGNQYSLGMGVLFFTAPLAFFLGRMFYFVFLACPGSKMLFFNWERGGSMFLGAFTGGVFGTFIYFELKKVPRIEGLEIFVPYIPVGGIFGRLGCFCEGCCYGTVTDSIFGLRFPMGSPAWAEHVYKGLISSDQFFSLPVHPTQLYEIGMWILMGIILITIRNRKPRKETLILSFLILYFLMRFVEDFVRADYNKILWNLDLMQILALFIIPLSFLGILLIYVINYSADILPSPNQQMNENKHIFLFYSHYIHRSLFINFIFYTKSLTYEKKMLNYRYWKVEQKSSSQSNQNHQNKETSYVYHKLHQKLSVYNYHSHHYLNRYDNHLHTT